MARAAKKAPPKPRQKAPAGRGFPSLEEIRANPIPKIARKKGGTVQTDLALDLSSSCVGWALGMNKDLMLYGKFVFKSTAEPGEKLDAFARYLTVLLDVYQPDRILIEKPLLRRGKTTARHYEILGVVRAVTSGIRNMEIKESWLVPATTVKRIMRVKRGADHAENKLIMVNKINQLLGLDLRYAEGKYDSDDDIADAIAVMYTIWRKGSKE